MHGWEIAQPASPAGGHSILGMARLYPNPGPFMNKVYDDFILTTVSEIPTLLVSVPQK
jgi:hypothetical protein